MGDEVVDWWNGPDKGRLGRTPVEERVDSEDATSAADGEHWLRAALGVAYRNASHVRMARATEPLKVPTMEECRLVLVKLFRMSR